MELVNLKKIDLKRYEFVHEGWIQDEITKNPSILGLGELEVKDVQRVQPKAGRLDLLLQDIENNKRYEVEIQLGATDESHIIRTIEYWDIERRRYPQYKHCAVIIAENITSRFFNVIELFNRAIPLIAIKMSAYQIEEKKISLIFTTVLEETSLGLIEDDENESRKIVDRKYWEENMSKQTINLVDSIFEIVKDFDSDLELKYRLYYVGCAKKGQFTNFARFRAKKNGVLLEVKLGQSIEIKEKLDNTRLNLLEYIDGRYRIKLYEGDAIKYQHLLKELLKQAYLEDI